MVDTIENPAAEIARLREVVGRLDGAFNALAALTLGRIRYDVADLEARSRTDRFPALAQGRIDVWSTLLGALENAAPSEEDAAFDHGYKAIAAVLRDAMGRHAPAPEG